MTRAQQRAVEPLMNKFLARTIDRDNDISNESVILETYAPGNFFWLV
jgi:hypothetical protein